MTHSSHYRDISVAQTTPFESAQDAWFWFIAAQAAKNDGARFVSGAGLYKRPCEPIDILKTLDRLYRNRRLLRDHLLVLRHYGRRNMAPDPTRVKEERAHRLWSEAMERIEEVLTIKGIVEPLEPRISSHDWTVPSDIPPANKQVDMFGGARV